MADVFLSYSKSRRELTESLARDLEAKGYSVWWDTSLLPTDNFRREIDYQLNEAKAVIIVWTPESTDSKWVCAEADHADSQRKLINTRSSDLAPQRIPKPFNQIHAVDLDDRAAIIAAIRKLIESEVPGSSESQSASDLKQLSRPYRSNSNVLVTWLHALGLSKIKYIALAALVPLFLYIFGPFFQLVWPSAPIYPRIVQFQQQIHTEFAKQKANLDLSRPADFSGVERLLTALKTIDGKNGTIRYYEDELLRIQMPALFTTERCPKPLSAGVTDLSQFEHNFDVYLERAPAPAVSSEQDSDKCYDTPGGYCAQRSEWVDHLLANDYYQEALVQPAAQKGGKLQRARQHIKLAMLYRDKEKRSGFTQCIASGVLLNDIDKALAALAHPAVQATNE